MQAQTVLLIVLAFLVALGLVFMQYFYKGKRTPVVFLLGGLRFIAVFAGLLLLVNPKFSKTEYTSENTNLLLLSDNSTSITNLSGEGALLQAAEAILTDQDVQNKYTLKHYSFGESIQELDTIPGFTAKRTNISRTLKTLDETFANKKNMLVLLTDGNQTVGEDFEFLRLGTNSTISAVVVGDTTTYRDLRFGQINLNRYAFLGNAFPIEAEVVYAGNTAIATNFQIYMDGKLVFQEGVQFATNEGAKTVSTTLQATDTGLKTLEFRLSPLENERNTDNNRVTRFLEVIDEKTTIGIVSAFKHPDIGALKEAIETNEQRSVRLLDTRALPQTLEDIDVFILYQPDASFAPVYDVIEQRGGGRFTITGPETDWSIVQARTSGIQKENLAQDEYIFPDKNAAFDLFDTADFAMLDYPPLTGELGGIQIIAAHSVLAYQRIRGVNLDDPLFFILEETKQAFLLGADIWKWRAQSFRNTGSFTVFDGLIGKLLLFLSDTEQKERLRLDYQNRYDNSAEARISASFFDKTYVFDRDAALLLNITGVNNDFKREEPMLLKGNQFTTDLSDLEAGEYRFTVTETQDNISKSGRFNILDFDLESQSAAADGPKLERLASGNGGSVYYPDEVSDLLLDLANDQRFVPIQKSNKNVVSLIDFRWLLALIAITLALEWGTRKYNGLL